LGEVAEYFQSFAGWFGVNFGSIGDEHNDDSSSNVIYRN